MTKVIRKYAYYPIITMPENTEIIRISKEFNGLYIWVLCDPDTPIENYKEYNFWIYGTNETINDIETKKYLGSYEINNTGTYHLFLEEG